MIRLFGEINGGSEEIKMGKEKEKEKRGGLTRTTHAQQQIGRAHV